MCHASCWHVCLYNLYVQLLPRHLLSRQDGCSKPGGLSAKHRRHGVCGDHTVFSVVRLLTQR